MDEQKRNINREKVAAIRKRLGMTQKEFGEAVGLTQSGLNNLEKGYLLKDGSMLNVRIDVFWRIAQLGGVSMEWLLDLVEDTRPVEELLKRPVSFANEYLELLLEYAQRLTPQEQQMIALLCKRISETAPTKTQEGQEAAILVDAMPEYRRAEALAKLRDLASKKEKAELRRQFGYLIQLIKDETGEDMTAKVEELFHVWLTNGNGKQSIGEEITQKGIDITQ